MNLGMDNQRLRQFPSFTPHPLDILTFVFRLLPHGLKMAATAPGITFSHCCIQSQVGKGQGRDLSSVELLYSSKKEEQLTDFSLSLINHNGSFNNLQLQGRLRVQVSDIFSLQCERWVLLGGKKWTTPSATETIYLACVCYAPTKEVQSTC